VANADVRTVGENLARLETLPTFCTYNLKFIEPMSKKLLSTS